MRKALPTIQLISLKGMRVRNFFHMILQGYFQSLLSIVEQLLIKLKVKFLILPADEDTQSIWINKFGFTKMTDEQVNSSHYFAH